MEEQTDRFIKLVADNLENNTYDTLKAIASDSQITSSMKKSFMAIY